MFAVEFQTPRLLLKPFDRQDVTGLHAHWIHPDVRRYLWDDVVISELTAGEAVTAAIESAANDGPALWTVRKPGENGILGCCGFRNAGNGEVELLFSLDPRFWGQGLIREACRAVLRYGFEVCGYRRVLARTDRSNRASLVVMRRLVFSGAREFEDDGRNLVECELTREAFFRLLPL